MYVWVCVLILNSNTTQKNINEVLYVLYSDEHSLAIYIHSSHLLLINNMSGYVCTVHVSISIDMEFFHTVFQPYQISSGNKILCLRKHILIVSYRWNAWKWSLDIHFIG